MAERPWIPTNGAVIRALRQAYGLKLHELALDLGITMGHLSNVELRKVNAPYSLLTKIAARLNVPLQAVVLIHVDEIERRDHDTGALKPAEPVAA